MTWLRFVLMLYVFLVANKAETAVKFNGVSYQICMTVPVMVYVRVHMCMCAWMDTCVDACVCACVCVGLCVCV